MLWYNMWCIYDGIIEILVSQHNISDYGQLNHEIIRVERYDIIIGWREWHSMNAYAYAVVMEWKDGLMIGREDIINIHASIMIAMNESLAYLWYTMITSVVWHWSVGINNWIIDGWNIQPLNDSRAITITDDRRGIAASYDDDDDDNDDDEVGRSCTVIWITFGLYQAPIEQHDYYGGVVHTGSDAYRNGRMES